MLAKSFFAYQASVLHPDPEMVSQLRVVSSQWCAPETVELFAGFVNYWTHMRGVPVDLDVEAQGQQSHEFIRRVHGRAEHLAFDNPAWPQEKT